MPAAETARLIASLELQNKLGPGVASALGDVGKLETRLGRIGEHAKRGVSNAATNIKNLGLVAGGLLATQVYAGVRSLEELERVSNATAGVIESTGGAAGVTADEVRRMAQELELLTTADDKAIQGGQNLLLTFTNIGEDVFPRASKAIVDLGIAMAQGDVANADFKSSAIQVGKALNDPIRGVTALRRVGVSFTKQQLDQIKAMQEAGDVAGAQAIILQELEKEFGKAGEAAGKGFGGDMRRFQDAVEDGQQALARGFLPLISRVSRELQTKLSDPAVLKGIEEFGEGLADGFDQALEIARKIPWSTIGDAMRLAGQGAKAALDFFAGLPPWVQTAVVTGWGLNKLTGGALGGIVGELGKGLVKGVLGMNAGVVNINAARVGGLPGVVAGGGGKASGKGGVAAVSGGVLGVLSKVFIVGAAVGVFSELTGALNQQTTENKQAIGDLATQTGNFAKSATFTDIRKSLTGIEADAEKLRWGLTPESIAYALNIDGVRDAVNDTRTTLNHQLITLAESTKGAQDETTRAVNVGAAITNSTLTQTKASIIESGNKAKNAGDKTASAVNAAKSVMENVKTAVGNVKAATDAAKSTISQAQYNAAERVRQAVNAKDLSVTIPITNNISSRTYMNGRQVAIEVDRSTTFAKPGAPKVAS